MNFSDTLERMIRKFERRAPLDDSDRAALRSLPFTRRTASARSFIVREGSSPDVSCLLLSGYTFRQKLTGDGGRQIVSFHLPGDFMDLEGSLLSCADHNIQALTRVDYAAVPVRHILDLIDNHPRLARAMWIDTLVDASIYREWVLNVGRRNARERIGHLLCEFALRLDLAGLGTTHGYQCPMNQEQIADCTGLTPIHVNRTLKAMEAEGLIRRHLRFIEIPDWKHLREASGFDDTYLHLRQVGEPVVNHHVSRTRGSQTGANNNSVSAQTSASARSGECPGPA